MATTMPTTVMGGGGTGAYGSTPASVSPVSTVNQATENAIGAGLNVYSQLPGYGSDMSNIGSNIASETAGQVPEDVINELKQQGAEGDISTGASSNASYLRALGLTSLGLENTGLSQLESVLPTLPGAAISQSPLFEPTTAQTLEAGQQNSIWAAAPNPAAAAKANLAAAGAGIAAGSLSDGGGLPPTPGTYPGTMVGNPAQGTVPINAGLNPWDTPAPTSPWDSGGYAPGSPGADTNWATWYSQMMGLDPTSVTGNDASGTGAFLTVDQSSPPQ